MEPKASGPFGNGARDIREASMFGIPPRRQDSIVTNLANPGMKMQKRMYEMRKKIIIDEIGSNMRLANPDFENIFTTIGYGLQLSPVGGSHQHYGTQHHALRIDVRRMVTTWLRKQLLSWEKDAGRENKQRVSAQAAPGEPMAYFSPLSPIPSDSNLSQFDE